MAKSLAQCTLDFSHPYFQKAIRQYEGDEGFQEALAALKIEIEKNHECCHRVVQPFGNKKFEACYGKVWKYDWSPPGYHSKTRKSWRLVVIVPEPSAIPLRLIAGTLYSKSAFSQLPLKQLAAIFAAVTGVSSKDDGIGDGTAEIQMSEAFKRVDNGDGKTRSICMTCIGAVAISALTEELDAAEKSHECPGSPFQSQPEPKR